MCQGTSPAGSLLNDDNVIASVVLNQVRQRRRSARLLDKAKDAFKDLHRGRPGNPRHQTGRWNIASDDRADADTAARYDGSVPTQYSSLRDTTAADNTAPGDTEAKSPNSTSCVALAPARITRDGLIILPTPQAMRRQYGSASSHPSGRGKVTGESPSCSVTVSVAVCPRRCPRGAPVAAHTCLDAASMKRGPHSLAPNSVGIFQHHRKQVIGSQLLS
jgi:hypothetical protein